MAVFVSGQITIPKRLNDTFSANSWSDIVTACQTNNVPAAWNVGDSKSMTIDGVTYQIDIIGKNHDTYSDGTGLAPLTFQFHESYTTTYRMNSTNVNSTGWLSSEMRLNNILAIFNLLPLEVRSGIRQVNKLTTVGGQQSTVNIGQDNLFLLSEVEVFGETSFSKSGEGVQYEYYAKGLPTIKKRNDSDAIWWLRSPHGTGNTQFCAITATGTPSNTAASSVYGVSPAFCF